MNSRFIPILQYISLIGLFSGSSFFKKYMQSFFKKNKDYSLRSSKIKIYWIFILLLVVLIQNFQNAQNLENSSWVQSAVNQTVPYEENMIFQNLNYENKVFLTDHYMSLVYLPIFLFISTNVYYAHPASLNNQRSAFLYNLSQYNNPEQFYNYLVNNNSFGHIDYFYLDSYNSTDYVFKYTDEQISSGFCYRNIFFNKSVFENSKFFKEIDIHGQILFQTIYKPITQNVVPNNTITINDENDLEEKFGTNNSTGNSLDNAYLISNKIFNGSINPDKSSIAISNCNKFIIISNCTFINTGFSGSIIGGIKLFNDSNIDINNCTFVNNSNGIFIKNCNNINITSSNFIQNKIDGFYSIYSASILIKNCNFENNQYSGTELYHTYLVTMENNQIVSSNTNYFSSFGINMYHVFSSNFENNSILDSKYYGVGITNSEQLTFQNNSISHSNIGIMVNNSKDSNFTRDFISDSAKFGMNLIASYNISIYKEYFTSNNIAGLFLDQTSNSKILNNKFKLNDQYGLYLESSNSNYINNNIFEKNIVMGYYIDYYSQNNWVF